MKTLFVIIFMSIVLCTEAQTANPKNNHFIKKKEQGVELISIEKLNRHLVKRPKKGEKIKLKYYSKNSTLFKEEEKKRKKKKSKN